MIFDLLSLAFSILFLFFVILFFLSPTNLKSYLSGAPPVPTPKKDIRKAFQAAELKKGEKIYDLGSGSGKVLLIAEKEFSAEAVGFEYSLGMTLLSRLILKIRGSKSKVVNSDFLEADLSEVDLLYIYGSMSLMKKLKKKFSSEVVDVRLVSYCFNLPDKEPKKTVTVSSGKKIFIYDI